MNARPLTSAHPGVPSTALDGAAPSKRGLHWPNLLFLGSLHLVALGGLFAYGRLPSAVALLLCAGGFLLTTFAISAGYHRLFSHRSFTTGPVFEIVLLLMGSAALQNSALTWSRKHRTHHQHTDTHLDPYDAKRGFWYSHIGWVLEKDGPEPSDVSDLTADRWVRWQHQYYVPLAIVTGFLVPMGIGWVFGDALGGLLFGGLWRLVLAYHVTFSINSFAHLLGKQPYSSKHTARDNLLTALITMGEGYHNFHHTFPGDYRNGVRFFDFDPPKWVLAVFARLGWIRDVRRTPGHVIALRRLKQARQQVESHSTLSPDKRQELMTRAEKLKQLLTQWAQSSLTHGSLRHARKLAVPEARLEFWTAFNAWEAEVLALA